MTHLMFCILSYHCCVKFIAFHIPVYCYLRLIDKPISIKIGRLSPPLVVYYYTANQFYVRIFLGLKPLQGLKVLSQYPFPLLHYELPLAALLHLPSFKVSQNTTFILPSFCPIFRCCNEMV